MSELLRWISEAAGAGVANPTAMVLATAGPGGTPSARAVIASTRVAGALTFFTDYESPKGRHIATNANVEGVFLWTQLERQVRVSGVAAPVPAAESDAYWASRPRSAQLAIASARQSAPAPDHASLVARKAALEAQAGGANVPRPESYGGYRLTPRAVEFWQGRPEDRLHLRALYERDASGGWTFGFLAP